MPQSFIGTRKKKEKKALENIKSNPQAFFKYANSSRSVRSKIGPLQTGETYTSNPKKMADILSYQYKSVFSTPCDNLTNLEAVRSTCPPLNNIIISEESTISAIKDMNSSSSPGPDGIASTIYKEYSVQLAQPITQIWRLSLDTGKLPEGIAQAVITPIYKGGVKSLPANYRPVALTNHLTKIFERILRK